MTTLTAGNSASFSIGPYETLTIRTGGRGSLSFTSLAENAHPSFTANVANGNYGPYGVAMQVLMTMTEGSAEYEHSAPDAGNLVTSTTNLTGGIELSAGGSGAILGSLVSGQWFNPTSIFRLLCTGTGTVTLDSKDAAGTITAGVFSVTLASAVNQIEFPYAGDGAIQIRATLTGTATAKVI